MEEVLTSLGMLFRGATAYPKGRGAWRDDDRGGILIREEPVIVFSYAAKSAVTVNALSALYLTLSKMGRETNQGEIGLVLDGRYYGITKYGEAP